MKPLLLRVLAVPVILLLLLAMVVYVPLCLGMEVAGDVIIKINNWADRKFNAG